MNEGISSFLTYYISLDAIENAKPLFTDPLKTLKGVDAFNVRRILGDIDKILELGHKIKADNVN